MIAGAGSSTLGLCLSPESRYAAPPKGGGSGPGVRLYPFLRPKPAPPSVGRSGTGQGADPLGLAQCDVAKISDDELLFLTGETDFDAGAAKLIAQFPNLQMVNVTAGAQGSISYYQAFGCFSRGDPRRRDRDHRRGRYLLRLRSELPAGAWPGASHCGRSHPDAPLCQRGGLSGHHPAGRHPLHAGAGAGTGSVIKR